MPTAEEVLNASRANIGKGPEEFWSWYPAPAGTAWCCIYQSKVLTDAGIPTHYAWVSGLFDLYRSRGRTYAPREAQPGDLIAFDYDGSGPSSYDHIAMVESVSNAGITAINGNWENKVCRVFHRFNAGGYAGGIAEIARPDYTTPTPPPSPEGVTVYQFTRTKDDRIVLFGIGMGAVAHRWQANPNGNFTDWVSLSDGQPFSVEALTVERNADGRFEIMAWGSKGTCYRTQNLNGSWRPWRTTL